MTEATQALFPVTPEQSAKALKWINHNLHLAANMMKTSVEAGNGYANFAAHDAHQALTVAKAAIEVRISHSPPGDVGTDLVKRAEAIINANSEYMEGFDRGQRHFGRDAVLRMVIAALTPSALSGDAGEVELRKELELSLSILDNVGGFLDDFAQADLDEGAADAVTVGMVYQQQAQTVVLPRITKRLAALRAALSEEE